jgi:hypothetical protein
MFQNGSIHMKSTIKPMLAYDSQDYFGDIDLAFCLGVGVYIQQKINGIRAIATREGIFSRNGNPICSNLFSQMTGFFKAYPDVVLDGELFAPEADSLPEVLSLVKSNSHELVFYVFDLVNDKCQFERFSDIQNIINFGELEFIHNATDDAAIRVLPWKHIKSWEDYHEERDYLRDRGAEGIMIRKTDGAYQHKRSTSLLKDKFYEQDEFIMFNLGVEGELMAARVAALRTEAGIEFLAPIVGKLENWNVTLPAKVIVRHTGFILGMPQNPVALCVV